MKWLIPFLALCVVQHAQADAASDAYSAGASLAGSSKGQGTAAAKSTDPSSVIPGYTSSPSQSGYYGGVQGGDGGISDKGQTELSQNEAGQAITDSSTKNPAVTIDPNADFIQNGKNAEANSGTIVDGTNQQCTTKVVSKSVFENYSCDRDVAQVQTCARTATVGGHYEDRRTQQTVTIDSDVLKWDEKTNTATWSGSMPSGTVISSTFTYTFNKHLAFSNSNWFMNVTVLGQKFTMYDESGSYNVAMSPVDGTGGLTFLLGNRSNSGGAALVWNTGQTGNKMWHFVLTVTVENGTMVYVPDTTWSESCGFDKSKATASTGSVCTDPGGTRTVTVDGQTYSQYQDCWQYSDSYVVPVNSTGNCSTLMANKNCTVTARACTQAEGSTCLHEQDTYQCQTTYSSQGLLCGGNYLCQSGSCDETNGAGDSGFDTAVAKLAGLASAGDDVKADQVNVKAFTGQALYCRKAMAGFSNCCVDTGWGNSAGLANCNSDEMAIGKAKAKKVTVLVGEACNKAVLGVCVQKKQAYCVFGGKLARIIQEQGRRDQLHVSFGSGDSPNCRGITVPELQAINFDLINFQDFYSDLVANQKIPDSATMVKQAKDRIAAQVNAQTGGK